ncbi:MAG: glycosyltransferase [Planctomycetota bacterium]|nr:glycosyltransferase [Planctomycetota bacterium]
MKVGIDYYPAVSHAPGIGRYSRELVRALVRLSDCPELHLADIGRHERIFGEPALGLADAPHRAHLHELHASRKLFSLRHRLFGHGADTAIGGVDLFHRMFPAWPPVAKARELQPILQVPRAGSPEDAELALTARRAGHVLVFSRRAGGEMRSRYGLEADAVHQVPIGCDHWLRDAGDPPFEKKDPPQVLVLGPLSDRRKPGAVLHALEKAVRRRQQIQLLYVGSRGGDEGVRFLREDLGSFVRNWVLINEQAREEDLPGIVASSSLLIHLSDDEASAITPLEAFAFGVPVIASRLPAFEEALGEEAVFVEHDVEDDPKEFGAVILEALQGAGDEAAAERRRAIGQRHSWEANARATVEVWSKVLGEG